MALRLVINAVKTRFPKVPVMTTDELQNLMRASQAQRKLILLVSKHSRVAVMILRRLLKFRNMFYQEMAKILQLLN